MEQNQPVGSDRTCHADFATCLAERQRQTRQCRQLFQAISSGPQSPKTLTLRGDGTATAIALRPLTAREQTVLESPTCRCRLDAADDSTTTLWLALSELEINQDQSQTLSNLVSDCCFSGPCLLMLTPLFVGDNNNDASTPPLRETAASRRLPRGIHGCALVRHVLIDLRTAAVHKCTVVESVWIRHGACVVHCGHVMGGSRSACSDAGGSSLEIHVGPEAGGRRSLVLSPEATMMDVGRQLRDPQLTESASSSDHAQDVDFAIVGSHCVVRDTGTVECVFLHANVIIASASCVDHTVLHSGARIEDSSTVSHSHVQWQASILGQSSVSHTSIMEAASIGPSSVVAHSVVGPDSHVSAGEVHASVLGPNSSAHHQSLLVSVLWPSGRGNVGYGANVGSNHTGRSPDQECSAGEGVFWGLSCVVKFPVDLSEAVYSVVAAGTALAPQRITMPFSLLVDGSSEYTSTSILPGWVLQNSPYTIVRSETKFATRRKARRHSSYTGYKIIRSETVQQCMVAREALQACSGSSTYQRIPGIGATVLTEKARTVGIQAYTECIQRFALSGLYSFLCRNQNNALSALESARMEITAGKDKCDRTNRQTMQPATKVNWPEFPWEGGQSVVATWSKQTELLGVEFPEVLCDSNKSMWAKDLLKRYLHLEESFCERVYKCKRRDDTRGISIIPDYEAAHVMADQDPVVVGLRKELAVKKERIQSLVMELDGSGRSRL